MYLRLELFVERERECLVLIPFILLSIRRVFPVYVSRSQPPRPTGKEDEAKEEEGLFSGRSGEAGAEGHE